MTAKAVFVSQTFAVYVTGEELRELCETRHVVCSLFLGKHQVFGSGVEVELGDTAQGALSEAREIERAAIDAGKAKLPPRPAGPGAASRRRKARSHD